MLAGRLISRSTRAAGSRSSTASSRRWISASSSLGFPAQGAPPKNGSPRSPSSTSSSSDGSASSTSSSSSSSSQQPKSDVTSKYEKQRQREWIIVGVSGLIASFGAYYWLQRGKGDPAPSSSQDMSTPKVPPRFTINTRSPLTGERTKKLIYSLSAGQVDKLLTENERTETVKDEPGTINLVARYDTNSVASNDPIEDRRAEAIVESSNVSRRGAESQSPNTVSDARGNLAFFAVMDGHSGFHTSAYLSQKLIAFVAVELDKVFHELGDYGKIAQTKAAMPKKLWQYIAGTSTSPSSSGAGLNGDPEIIKRAITRAFVGLDKEIVNTPVELLKEYELYSSTAGSGSAGSGSSSLSSPSSSSSSSLSTLAHSIFPAPGSSSNGGQVATTATQRSAYEVMKPALSGSCALLTYIDSAQRDIYVACTGDSRAIAGWFDPRTEKWAIEPLSTDQTGRNPNEVRRMQSEHPASESNTVIMRGRVLGGLEPTRAFGDARYKWTPDLQRRLRDAFVTGAGGDGAAPSVRGPPQLLQTPPYVTARPEIEWRRLPTGQGAKQLKFIVMATDGLWDMLSNEEVGSLVAGHLANVKGEVGATQLQESFLQARSGSASALASSLGSTVGATTSQQQQQQATPPPSSQQAPQGHHPLSRTNENRFIFRDQNLATHLVRNALGGANQPFLSGLLSIPAPDARRYRDDITVNVILLKDDQAATADSEGGSAHKDDAQKAKL